jgi:hypothetical protein
MGHVPGLNWVCATVAPWALAAGLLVSFTAVASNDPQAGISAAPRLGLRAPDTLVPGSGLLGNPIRLSELALGDALASPAARIRIDSAAAQPEAPLRATMKVQTGAPPAVNRGTKGAPAPGLRASLSRNGLDLARDAVPLAGRLAFLHDNEILPPTVLMPGSVAGPDWEAARGLEPWTGEDPTTTSGASSVQSPAAAAAGSTGAARGPSRTPHGGATPAVSRAMALSSTTPAPAEAVPLEVALAPVTPRMPGLGSPLGGSSAFGRGEAETRPRYADLIPASAAESEQRCLAEVVYFESRSEPPEGQAAVAQVVLNRVRSGLYPASVCGVVYQNRHRHLACQFTFACEGKALRITDTESWDNARRIARDVTEGRTYLAEVGGATHYHADYVRPGWARRLKKMDTIGRHIFYQLKPGQT